MSVHAPSNAPEKSITVPDLRRMKGTPQVWLTAYTTPMAKLLDPHCDVLLVGDSLGMVLYGLPSTLAVSLDTMIAHGAAVVRGAKRACVVVDLPFGTYQQSKQQAFSSAARVLAETGASAVKLEGGVEMAETIAFLTARGIPVCGHVGLMPQSVNVAGGFRATGRTDNEAAKVTADAHAVSDAGAFAVVVEGTLEPVAAAITRAIAIPTIGIGASAACDGQVLVIDDVLGMFNDFTPRFVKRYAAVGEEISRAAAAYAGEVRARVFPAPEHTFRQKK
jgi:3-methyl-2-oxobutanoate hydroxymethyltransferase